MTFYFYRVRIFDTAPDAKTDFFPRCEPYTAVAADKEEAQRQITDDIFDPETGLCGTRLRETDPADRFRLCFDEPEIERPVEWAEEIGRYIYADEDREAQIATFQNMLQKAQ